MLAFLSGTLPQEVAMRRTRSVALAVLALLAAGCAGSISPQTVRAELVRQSGKPPAREFEFTMGRLTTALLKSAIGPGPDGRLPLAGLSAIELAVYGLPAGTPNDALDFSQMTPYGWENVVRYKEGSRSVLVMIRGGADSIRDLALVAAGASEVVYGRLRGHLPASLPEAIREAVSKDGTASVKRQLLDAAGTNED
jgi:hypothetical protein